MSMMQEFKTFAMRGNVIDLAVGVVIGTAFGKIVSSLVGDVIMPLLGFVTGGINFTKMAITLKAAEGETPAVLLSYGSFVQTVFDFVLVALAIFLMVRAINNLKKPPNPEAPAAAPEPSVEERLLAEIRDLLKHKIGSEERK